MEPTDYATALKLALAMHLAPPYASAYQRGVAEGLKVAIEVLESAWAGESPEDELADALGEMLCAVK
jgi:hypothetical protein